MTELLPYPTYKYSGVPWVGEVPQLWDVARLRYLARIETGGRDTVDSEVDGSYPFFVRSQTVEAIDTFGYDCEAVLTAGDGAGVGKVFHHFTGKFEAHQRVYVMQNFKRISGRFFYYYFQNLFSKVALDGGAKSTVDSLRRPMLTDFPVTVPTAPEQKAIVDFLDRETAQIDALIGKQERLIELLAEKRQAVITHAVTKGLDPTVPTKSSGVPRLGQVPEHWSLPRLKACCRVKRGRFMHRPRNAPHLYDGEYPFIQTGSIARAQGKHVTEYSQTLSEAGLETSAMMPKGTLVMAIAANIGDVAILSFDSCAPDSVVGFQPTHRTNADFLYYALTAKRAELTSEAPVTSQGNLNVERVGGVTVPLPPIEEQQEIVTTLDHRLKHMTRISNKASDAVRILRERRSALIFAAVTGKISVQSKGVSV